MTTCLAEYFEERRLAKSLRLSQVATLIGYRNAGKGSGRIHIFESTGKVHPDLLKKLASALEVEWSIVIDLVKEDERRFFVEWNRWANEPITPHIVIRWIPAVYSSESLPSGISNLEEAESFAMQRARAENRKVCLVVSRRYSVWVDEIGEAYSRSEAAPGLPNSPFMRLPRSRCSFQAASLTRDEFVRLVMWPKKPGAEDKTNG